MSVPPAALLGPILIAVVAIALTLVMYMYQRSSSSPPPCSITPASRIREMLPKDLATWRIPGRYHEDEVRVWVPLVDVLHQRGLALWSNRELSLLRAPDHSEGGSPLATGYAYVSSYRGLRGGVGSAKELAIFNYTTNSTRIARNREGVDVAVRVIAMKHEGHEHLRILRKIAAGPVSLLCENHTLPLLSEFQFEDVIFGISPRVGGCMEEAFSHWAKNSVGDVMDMLMQGLEDAFIDNFLVQWQPESMETKSGTVCRPRVYLIDFEVAVEFGSECTAGERLCTGYPHGGTVRKEEYARPVPPEANIEEIDEFISELTCADAGSRMDGGRAVKKLQKIMFSMPPSALLIAPEVVKKED